MQKKSLLCTKVLLKKKERKKWISLIGNACPWKQHLTKVSQLKVVLELLTVSHGLYQQLILFCQMKWLNRASALQIVNFFKSDF